MVLHTKEAIVKKINKGFYIIMVTNIVAISKNSRRSTGTMIYEVLSLVL